MRLKRIGAITLAALMTAGTLAGCSGGTETKETQNAQTTAAAAETTAASSDGKAASGEKTVINIWSKDRHDASYVQEKVDEYNKTNTDNIQVN